MDRTQEELIAERQSGNGESKFTTTHESRLWVPLGKLSWGAIFAGVLVTAVTQMLLSLLGVGIGLSTVDTLADSDPMRGLGIGSILWWSLTMLVSLFMGGWTSGKVSKAATRPFLAWHGLITWCTFTVISFFILTSSARMALSGAGNILGTALTAGANLANRPAELDISNITGDAGSLLYPGNNSHIAADNRTGTLMEDNRTDRDNANRTRNNRRSNGIDAIETSRLTPQSNTQVRNTRLDANPYYMDQVRNFFSERNVRNAEGRKALVRTISQQTGMTQAEADAKVGEWIDSYGRLKAEAKVKADNAARAASTASIIGFFALIIGALVTVWGARVATYGELSNLRTSNEKRPYNSFINQNR